MEPPPTDANYWTYWVHKVQELWKRIEALEGRIEILERNPSSPQPPRESPAEDKPAALAERELTCCMVLKELGKPSTLEEINARLKSSRRIEEGLRETLLNRLKGAVEKGYIGYSEPDKTFVLARKSFVVE